MSFSAANYYRMTTATSIANSGTGDNPLTKPAGAKVASIAPGKRHSVFIPSEATFTTDFSLDEDGYAIMFYAKPEPGVVLEVEGNVVEYTGHSYLMENLRGQRVELPFTSNAARMVVFSYSNFEAMLAVDHSSGVIDAEPTDNSGYIDVSLLQSGGILDEVVALHGSLSSDEITVLAEQYEQFFDVPMAVYMNDDSRELVTRRTVAEVINVAPGAQETVLLRANDCNSFKIEYEITGDVQVIVNGIDWESGMTMDGTPSGLACMSQTGGTLTNLVITEYYSDDLGVESVAEISTDLASGTPTPAYRQDDNAGNRGDTTIVLEAPARISGWFYATDGQVLPGATMTDGILTATGAYINGEQYTGWEIQGWYFLSLTAEASGTVLIEVPTQALHFSTEALNADQLGDLYESFVGNPVLTISPEQQTFSDLPALAIATEWNIVASG